jgi:hypothetical protein
VEDDSVNGRHYGGVRGDRAFHYSFLDS